MSSKRRKHTDHVTQPGPDQQQIYPPDLAGDALSTIESTVEHENKTADETNVEEGEQTSKDYWGRGSQESDGAIPSEPPDTDPLRLQPVRKPKGPPQHNM